MVVAWRLPLWDTGTHQDVSEAGEGIRAFEGGFVSLGGGSCAAVLACGDGREAGCFLLAFTFTFVATILPLTS